MNKLIIVLALLLSGCATKPQFIERIPFPVEEYNNIKKVGNSNVTGYAFAKTPTGEIHFASGWVRLNPKTESSTQWFNVNYKAMNNIGEADPRYYEYIRKTKVDKAGKFTFKNVPAGKYYLSAPIHWYKSRDKSNDKLGANIKIIDIPQRLGGFLCFEIEVPQNQTLHVNITNED